MRSDERDTLTQIPILRCQLLGSPHEVVVIAFCGRGFTGDALAEEQELVVYAVFRGHGADGGGVLGFKVQEIEVVGGEVLTFGVGVRGAERGGVWDFGVGAHALLDLVERGVFVFP